MRSAPQRLAISTPWSVTVIADIMPSTGIPNEQRHADTGLRAAALVHSAAQLSHVSEQRSTRAVRFVRQLSMSAPDSGASRSRANWSSLCTGKAVVSLCPVPSNAIGRGAPIGTVVARHVLEVVDARPLRARGIGGAVDGGLVLGHAVRSHSQ